MSVRKERKAWRVDVNWRVPGSTTVQRHRRVLRTRREAEAYERQVRKALAERSFGLQKKRTPTLAEYEQLFMEASRAKGNKPRSLHAKEAILRRLVKELGAMLLDAPDMRARVGEYQARMLADGYSAKTVKNDMAVLEACSTWPQTEASLRACRGCPRCVRRSPGRSCSPRRRQARSSRPRQPGGSARGCSCSCALASGSEKGSR